MILLDTREYNHPVPLEMAVSAFKKLQVGEIIHMIHRKEPLPLFEIILKNGGFYRSYEKLAGEWHILITRDSFIRLEDIHV